MKTRIYATPAVKGLMHISSTPRHTYTWHYIFATRLLLAQ